MRRPEELPFGLGTTRRALLARAAALGAGLSAAGPLLASARAAANGLTGTIVLNNYPSWIGPKEIPTFEHEHPGATVKQVTNATSSSAEVVLAFKSGQYDLLLSDTSDAGQAVAAGVLQRLDFSKIPNIANVTPAFRRAYPSGIPTDYGKVGIGYRPDIVGERITSWADVWR